MDTHAIQGDPHSLGFITKLVLPLLDHPVKECLSLIEFGIAFVSFTVSHQRSKFTSRRLKAGPGHGSDKVNTPSNLLMYKGGLKKKNN